MIIKRLAEAIKHQSWFTVFIEVVTIVIGIFVGLQVDSWNDRRLRQQNVEFQLARIEADAKSLRERLDRQIDLVYRQLELLVVTLSILDGEPLTDENRDEFMAGLQASYQQRMVNLDIPSLQNLYESGEIELIADDDVRNTLMAHLLERRTRDESFAHQRRIWDMNLEAVFEGFTFEFSELDPESRTFRWDIAVDTDQLREDIEFRRALGNVARMQDYTLSTLQGMRESVGRVVIALETLSESTE